MRGFSTNNNKLRGRSEMISSRQGVGGVLEKVMLGDMGEVVVGRGSKKFKIG